MPSKLGGLGILRRNGGALGFRNMRIQRTEGHHPLRPETRRQAVDQIGDLLFAVIAVFEAQDFRIEAFGARRFEPDKIEAETGI